MDHQEWMLDVSDMLGQIKRGQDDMSREVRNVRSDLNNHKESPEAHGQGQIYRARTSIMWAFGLLVSVVMASMAIAFR
jgi:hypothetical protein